MVMCGVASATRYVIYSHPHEGHIHRIHNLQAIRVALGMRDSTEQRRGGALKRVQSRDSSHSCVHRKVEIYIISTHL